MDDLVRRVEQSIEQHALLRRGESVVVAVSGGVDSMVLLAVLHRLAVAKHWRLAVAHFNHQLRVADSDADEALVARTARRLSVRCVVDRADVRQYAASKKLSLELAARELRHDFLARAAQRIGAQVIALAHHADDQVELFFLRLLRGTGGSGLAGMKWSGHAPGDPRVRLIRPLLGVRKAALSAFAAEAEIGFREDASNRQSDFLRNRIRNELIPLLTGAYEPALARIILRLMEVAGAEADLAVQAARHWLNQTRRGSFDQLHLAVQRQCVRLQLAALGVSDDFDRVEHLRLRPGEPAMIKPGITVVRDRTGKVVQARIFSESFPTDQVTVELWPRAGVVKFGPLNIRWRIGAAPLRGWRAAKPRSGRERFDADKVGGQILLRHWRRGDRFQPIGMATGIKLQDLLTNQKVPRAQRHQRVVATTATGELFWVEGMRMAERFKLDNRTQRCLTWQWR
jgi:tRNA(Ile)-lysidine synthase